MAGLRQLVLEELPIGLINPPVIDVKLQRVTIVVLHLPRGSVFGTVALRDWNWRSVPLSRGLRTPSGGPELSGAPPRRTSIEVNRGSVLAWTDATVTFLRTGVSATALVVSLARH